jgi:hypothetical protein
MRKAHLRSPSEGLYPDSKSDRGESDTTLCGSLWDQAILRLDKKQQSIVTEIRNGSCKPDELLIEVNKEVEKCESRQWSIYETRSGRRIFLRDVLGRIAGFLQKVTAVGDTLVQYDPGHLSIPWAFARFLLVVSFEAALGWIRNLRLPGGGKRCQQLRCFFGVHGDGDRYHLPLCHYREFISRTRVGL